MSPVNHKGLHLGWTQTSLYLQINNFTSHFTTFFFSPIYIPRALNTGTYIQQGDLFYPAGLFYSEIYSQRKIGRGLEKMQVNGPEG